MRNAGRHICLLLDNFTGHYIDYKPHNIRLEYFAPNLTAHVQPCDAGIIRCIKAKYRRHFCLRAIALDKAEEHDIYKINLLEAMLMVREAWTEVTTDTIVHCWNHTKIQPSSSAAHVASTASPSIQTPSSAVTKGWDIIREFATTSITLPEAENRLKEALGVGYVDLDWQPALKAVMDAEDDSVAALEAIRQLTCTQFDPIPTSASWTTQLRPPQQLVEVEDALLDAVEELKTRRRIIGTPPTLEEMLNPVEERETGGSQYRFEGGDEEIARTVKDQMAVEDGCGMVVDSDSDEDEDKAPELSNGAVIDLCRQMESLCINHGSFDGALCLSRSLQQYRVHLVREQGANMKQTTMKEFLTAAGRG
jgi:hypothetical protein